MIGSSRRKAGVLVFPPPGSHHAIAPSTDPFAGDPAETLPWPERDHQVQQLGSSDPPCLFAFARYCHAMIYAQEAGISGQARRR